MRAFRKHLSSYRYALRGLWLVLRYENNMYFHIAATMAVLALNSMLDISRNDWLITMILIGLVWMAEIFNTAIEKLADRVTRKQDPLIGQAKDLAAGAVLVACVVAVVSAMIIYLPYMI